MTKELAHTPNVVDIALGHVPEKFRPIPAIALTAAVATLAWIDHYTHPYAGMADLARRKEFHWMGPLDNSIGNWLFSAAPMILATLAQEGLITYGEKTGNEKLVKTARHIAPVAGAVMANVNLGVEILLGPNREAVPDALVGFAAILGGYLATEAVISLCRNRQKGKG